jgi:hypothetical protein
MHEAMRAAEKASAKLLCARKLSGAAAARQRTIWGGVVCGGRATYCRPLMRAAASTRDHDCHRKRNVYAPHTTDVPTRGT